MRRQNLPIVVAVVCSWAAVSTYGKPVSHEKLAKHFNVTWKRITYSKSVSISNPPVGYTPGETSEGVSLNLEVEIKDPKLIFGTSRSVVLTDLKDGAGRALKIPKTHPSRIHDRYQSLQYRYRHQRASGPDTWIGKVRGFVGVSSGDPNPMETVMELQPSRLGIQFDSQTFPAGTQEIGTAKGYFHALVAESIDYVNVPFKPGPKWIQLTPDTEIRVDEAVSTGTSYRLNIEAGGSRRNRGMPFLGVGDPLPKRMVFGYELLDKDGEPVQRNPMMMGRVGGMIGGHVSGSGINAPVATIRYKILVNPAHCKVPFQVKNIPLPKP